MSKKIYHVYTKIGLYEGTTRSFTKGKGKNKLAEAEALKEFKDKREANTFFNKADSELDESNDVFNNWDKLNYFLLGSAGTIFILSLINVSKLWL